MKAANTIHYSHGLRVRDPQEELKNNRDAVVFPGGSLHVLNAENKTMFSIRMLEDGSLEIATAGGACRWVDSVLSTDMLVQPVSREKIRIARSPEDEK